MHKTLQTLSNPRLDILIICKSEKKINLIDNIIQFFQKKNFMCSVLSNFKNDDYLFFDDFNDCIALDIIA